MSGDQMRHLSVTFNDSTVLGSQPVAVFGGRITVQGQEQLDGFYITRRRCIMQRGFIEHVANSATLSLVNSIDYELDYRYSA